MKKIYGLSLALMLGYSANAQYSPGPVRFKKAPEHMITNGPVEKPASAAERGAPAFTEDFNIGAAPGSTTSGPTFTTSNGVWSTSGANGNIWKHTYNGSSGQFSTNIPDFAATTAMANGYMIFDADSANAVTPYVPFLGILESPVIDLSALTSFKVQFEHMFRFCCESTLNLNLGVSGDNGATWTDFPVWDLTPVNTVSANPTIANVNVTSALTGGGVNLTQVKIRFTWDGGTANSHYFWYVDDISIASADEHELELSNSFMYNAEPFWDTEMINYRQIPYVAAISIPYQGTNQIMISDIFNNGMSTETNVQLEGTILDASSSTVFSGSNNGGMSSLAPNATQYDTITPIDLSTLALGAYTAEFNLDYDSIAMDAVPSNNTATAVPFTIGGYDYGRDNDAYTNGGLYGGTNASSQYKPYIMGNAFQIDNNVTLYSIKVAFSGYNAATTAGSLVYPVLYEHDPSAASVADALVPLFDGQGTSYEVELTASQISSTNNVVWVDLVIPPTLLEAGKSYVASVAMYGGSDKVTVMNGVNNHDYVTTFLFDGEDLIWYYMTSTPKIRMNFFPQTIGTEELTQNGVTVSQNIPNPANETTSINYSLDKSSEVSLRIVDLTGKVILDENYGSRASGNHSINLDVKDFAAGVYYYTLNADGASITKKMVITE